MSLLQLRLGNGKTGVIELDTFTRMLNNQIYDDEEVRLDQPGYGLYDDGFTYAGLAPVGSAASDPVWSVIRKTLWDGRTTRIQFRENVVWNDRTIGWL